MAKNVGIKLPNDLIELLKRVSNSGFVAMPSKYDEFLFLYENTYRGNAHHKQFFDIINDELIIFVSQDVQ